ncbi:MAG: hypothetical protein ACOYVF_01960 [Candidatus Zixiibacteriota bacterium]
MNLPKMTLIYAVLLVLLGVGGYLGFGRSSVTALIPAFFGLLVLIAGVLGQREKFRRRAMHAVSALSLIGFLATVSGLLKLPALISGKELIRPAATVSQAIMAVLSFVFFLLCLKSFLDVRRSVKTAE